MSSKVQYFHGALLQQKLLKARLLYVSHYAIAHSCLHMYMHCWTARALFAGAQEARHIL